MQILSNQFRKYDKQGDISGNRKLNIMGNAANEELLASEEADRGSNAMKTQTNMDDTSKQKYAIRDASGNSYIVRIISAYAYVSFTSVPCH